MLPSPDAVILRYTLKSLSVESSYVIESFLFMWGIVGTDFLAQVPGTISTGSGRRICRINGALASSPRALDPRVVTCTNRVPGECEMHG